MHTTVLNAIRPRALLGLAIGAAAVALPRTDARAAWEVVPELRMMVRSTDNALLESREERSASRASLDAQFRLSNFTQRGNLYFEPSASVDTYTGSQNDALQSTDYFVEAGGARRWQRVTGRFRSNYYEESVLRAELASAVPEDLDDPDAEPLPDFDTGRLDAFTQQREQFYQLGNLDFRLSERNSFRVEVRRTDVGYTGETSFNALGYSDFDDTSLSLQLIRDVDERNQVTARMIVSEFNADLNDNFTRTVGVEGQFTRPLTQTWNLDLTVGVNRSDYEFNALDARIDNADTNFSFGMQVSKSTQLTRWTLGVYHRNDPTGIGFLRVRDEMRGYVQRQFTPRFNGRFGLRLSSSKTLDDVSQANDRDYGRLEARFQWAWKPVIFLEFGLNSTSQEFASRGSGAATSNAVFFGIRYRGMSRQ